MGGTNQWRRILVVAWARLKSDKGQELIEYALILALISIVSIGVLEALGVDLSGLLDQGSKQMSSVTNP